VREDGKCVVTLGEWGGSVEGVGKTAMGREGG